MQVGVVTQTNGLSMIAGIEDQILVTGANGFIGGWVVRALLARGFKRIRCLTRAATGAGKLDLIRAEFGASGVEVITGNLISPHVCAKAVDGVAVVYHLAAGVEKIIFPSSRQAASWPRCDRPPRRP